MNKAKNFSYARISAGKPGLNEEKYSYVQRDGYITFNLRKITFGELKNTPLPERGLKIHISLDDQRQDNVARGWDAIVGVLMHHDVARFKVCGPETEKDD